ncbi:MAG: hypothetical protein AAF950_08225 [Pseudomonadota bacterium]
MKQVFGAKAGETYASRKEALEAQAKAIEERLLTPQTPQPRLQPKGQVAASGNAIARSELEKTRVDIGAELKSIQKDMEKRKAVSAPSKVKTL